MRKLERTALAPTSRSGAALQGIENPPDRGSIRSRNGSV
jgi:hypothetical protein